MTSREPKSDPKAPPRLPYPATTDWAETAGDVHIQPPAETHQPLSRGSVPRFAEGRSIPQTVCVHAGSVGSPTRKKAVKSAASGRNGWETRSKSTNGTSSILTTPTIRPFTGLRGTGILARAEQGYDVDQIANDIGVSRQETSILHELPQPDESRSRWPKADWLVARED